MRLYLLFAFLMALLFAPSISFAREKNLIPQVGLFTGVYKTETIIFKGKSGPTTYEDFNFRIDKQGKVSGDSLRKTPFGGEGIRMGLSGKLYRTRPSAKVAGKIEGVVSFALSDGTEISGVCSTDELALSASCRMTIRYRTATADIVFTKSGA